MSLRKLDYIGICLMICGSTTAPVYYGFMCEESRFWGKVYLVQVWLFCFAALILTVLNRKGKNSKKANKLNAIAYLVAGYSTVPALYHLANSMEAG